MPRLSRIVVGLLLLSSAIPFAAGAQAKQRFATLDEALNASSALTGRSGPRSVNWIDDRARFSFIDRDARTNHSLIKAHDPATGRDTVLFSGEGLFFPGSNEAFSYDSFQWANDTPLGHL